MYNIRISINEKYPYTEYIPKYTFPVILKVLTLISIPVSKLT